MQTKNTTFILGRNIGVDWGCKEEGMTVVLDTFIPLPGLALPSGNVRFNLRTGHATTYNEAGDVEKDVDFVPIIAGL